MELLLNLAWALAAMAIVCHWLQYAGHGGVDRRTQLIALGLLIVILLPAISMTDDLQSMQNPAETDCCLRRSHVGFPLHPIVPVTAALPVPAFAEFPNGRLRLAALRWLPPQAAARPLPAPMQKRPPPAA